MSTSFVFLRINPFSQETQEGKDEFSLI